MRDHSLADGFRRNLALADAFKLAHDFRDHLVNALGIHWALAERYLHRAQELIAIEWHAAAVALDHNQFAQLDALEGREAEIAA
jgi:hypothetical protein